MSEKQESEGSMYGSQENVLEKFTGEYLHLVLDCK